MLLVFNPYYLCLRLQCITQVFRIWCFSICCAIVLHCHGVTSRSGLLSHDPGQFPADWNLGSIKLMNSFLIEPSYLAYDFILLQTRNEVAWAFIFSTKINLVKNHFEQVGGEQYLQSSVFETTSSVGIIGIRGAIYRRTKEMARREANLLV